MKNEILSLSKHTIIYTVGTLINRAASFIMLPIYTRYLTPADYGVMELLSMTIDVIGMIVGLGITSTVFKYYSEYEKKEEKHEVISTAIIMIFITAAITAASGLSLSNHLSQIVFNSADSAFYFKIIFLIYFFQSMSIVPFMLIRALQNSKLFVYISIIKLSIHLSLIILLLVKFRMGIQGMLYSTLFTEILIAVYLYLYTLPKVGLHFCASKAGRMLKFGYPFIFVSIGSFVITYSDRYFLNAYATLATVGIYSLAYKFGFLHAYLATGPFKTVWESQRFEIVKLDDASIIFKKIFLYFDIVVISLSLFISLFVKDILTIMSSPDFHDAYKLVPIIILAYVFQAWTFQCDIGLYIKEHGKHIIVAHTIPAIATIGLNFIMIPTYGAFGAAWATVGVFFLRFVLVHTFSQKAYRIDYGWHKHYLLIAFSAAIYFIGLFADISSLPVSLSANAVLMLLFFALVYVFVIERKERVALKEIIIDPASYKIAALLTWRKKYERPKSLL